MGCGNSFGKVFRITTFGESHGGMMGVVIDGCPSGLELHSDDFNTYMRRRRPGSGAFVSPRNEPDFVEIVSGVFEGKTTGAPLALLVRNVDAQSKAYEKSATLLRPGHAGYTFWKKWGHVDPRGGGRASARETVSRVCAGAVADKILKSLGIEVIAFIRSLGTICAENIAEKIDRPSIEQSAVRCPDPSASALMEKELKSAALQGESLGAIVEGWIEGLPPGLGFPVFDRFHAVLSHGMMSIPAARAFSIGRGFEASFEQGSKWNDSFSFKEGSVGPATNRSAGVMGGITTGEKVIFQVGFKPTSSINMPQVTCNTKGESQTLEWKEGFRHDPCVAIRGVAVVEAMASLVTLDFLIQRPLDTLEGLKKAL